MILRSSAEQEAATTPQTQTVGPASSLPAASTAGRTHTPFQITGSVIDSMTGSPVRNAKLTAAPMSTARGDRRPRRQLSGQIEPVATDSEGRFDLTVPSAGGWALTVEARGYRTQNLDEHNGYSTAVILTEATPKYEVIFRITPSSTIQGFVLDEAGEAVRSAQVALVYLPPPMPDNQHPRPQVRGRQKTDDRGFYKIVGVAPGNYQVRVSAEPWYASSSRTGFRQFTVATTVNSSPDPLDVVYPTVWFPGVTEPSAATPITLHGGEVQEANFRLLPVPGSHLHIDRQQPQPVEGNREVVPQITTSLTRLMADGTEEPNPTGTLLTDSSGNVDISGLSTGTYLVHQQLPGGGAASLSTLQVGNGSPRSLNLSNANPATIVTVQVNAAADLESLQISFRNLDSGQISYAQRFEEAGRTSLRRRDVDRGHETVALPADTPASKPDRTVSLQPGKYEVFLNGTGGDLRLTGIEATGATATGRTVTIGTGSPKLLLHVASGRGTVTGVVTFKGHADPGAMVLLIPATLGDPSGLDTPVRDQSNTDGSFEMSGVLPGGYILLAIDHGWDVNWSDAATLRRYLEHGMAIDIKPGSDMKQAIDAQSP